MGEQNRVLYESAYNKLFSVINDFSPISSSLCNLIYENSSFVKYAKGELLLNENRDSNVLFFVVEGFCACYYNKDGRECILRFAGEGEFCTSWHSFFGKQRSLVNLKAMEDTSVISFQRHQFDELREMSADYERLVCGLLAKELAECEERIFRMRSNRAEDRVRHYLDTHEIHELMKHVPRYIIASYLDMTQETFSKIFTQLSKEQ